MWLVIAGLSGFLAVLAGAVGSHALRGWVSSELLDQYAIAATYHTYHSLALLAIAVLAARRRGGWLTDAAGVCFVLGILLFSGSLYGKALTGIRALSLITPAGGVLLMLGWLCLALAGLRSSRRARRAAAGAIR